MSRSSKLEILANVKRALDPLYGEENVTWLSTTELRIRREEEPRRFACYYLTITEPLG